MSNRLFTSNNERLHVTSYTGPANTLERTRVRVQFEVVKNDAAAYSPAAGKKIADETSLITSLGFNDVVALYNALDRWIADHRGKEGS